MARAQRRHIHRVSSSEARANLAEILEKVDEGTRVLIERRGKTPVALISVDELLRMQLLEERDAKARRG